MILLRIDSIKEFMGILFSESRFDEFYLTEADIVTDCRIRIDGRRSRAFYDSDEIADGFTEFCTWAEKKKNIFDLIKGKRLPVSMKLVFRAPDGYCSEDCGKANGTIWSRYINLKYENQKLRLSSGSSCNVFSLDREPEAVWDRTVLGIMRDCANIEFEQEA